MDVGAEQRRRKATTMAIITMSNTIRPDQSNGSRQRTTSKVVSIADYRGVVLLPVRRVTQPVVSSSRWSTGPMTAA